MQPRSPSLRRDSCPAAGNAVSRQLSARSLFKDCLSHRESCPSSRPSLGSPHPSTDWGQVEGSPLSWVLLALEFPVELAEAVISSASQPDFPLCSLLLPSPPLHRCDTRAFRVLTISGGVAQRTPPLTSSVVFLDLHLISFYLFIVLFA